MTPRPTTNPSILAAIAVAALSFAQPILAVPAAPALAPPDTWVPWFRDDFDQPTLNLGAWTIEQANGVIEISGGALHLLSIPSGLPQIASNPGVVPLETDLRIRLGFAFGNTTCYGSAIAAQVRGVQLPGCGPNPPEVPYYGFHRDCARGTSACTHPVTLGFGPCGVDPLCLIFEPGAPQSHVGELTFVGGTVTTVVDGVELESLPGPWPTPNTLWFGSVGDPCCSYTELSIDFVEVLVPNSVVPVRRSAWARLKAFYR